MVAYPEKLNQREVRKSGIASEAKQAFESYSLSKLVSLIRASLIAPNDGRPQNLAVATQNNGAVHLPGEPDARNP